MSEQAPVEETPETPEESVAVDEQPEVNWEKRYNDLRPEFDRTSQEAAQYRALVEGLSSEDLDTRRQAAEQLGIEFVDTEDTDDAEDEWEDPTVQRLTALEQRIAAREAADETAREQAYVDQAASIVSQQLETLTDDQDMADMVFAKALTMPKTPEGLPDIEAAHAAVVAYETARMKQWASSKKGTHVSPVGTSGTQDPNLPLEANHSERTDHMYQRYVALSDDS